MTRARPNNHTHDSDADVDADMEDDTEPADPIENGDDDDIGSNRDEETIEDAEDYDSDPSMLED